MPDLLRMQLLGRFEVFRGGAPIPPAAWRGQKTRDLLKILLLARGRFLSKDQLCDWLWPGADPATAEANLRSTVSDLRRLLEPDLKRGRDSAFILTRREGYAFDLNAPASVDLIEFERARQVKTRADLEAALALYHGDLLEEDPYAEWAIPERERLRALRLEALARLAEMRLAEADYPAAIAAYEQALALDAGRETLWRALMRAHASSGDRAAALRAFDRCRAALSRDLGVDPLPETLALHAQILRDDFAAPPPSSPMPLAQVKAAEPRWLYRLGAGGLFLWVILTGTSFGLSWAGLLRGSFVSPGDPGSEALPYLASQPGVIGALDQLIYLFPLGLALLPGYLAWFTALRARVRGAGQTVSAPAWIGVGSGIVDVSAQTLSRAINLAKLAALPSAYAAAAPDQRLTLVALWDVLRQLASAFGVISATANPLAVGLLCWAARKHPRFSPGLAWSGLALAGLTLFYNFFSPGAPPTSLLLLLGLGLTLATFAWLLGLAVTLWRL